MINDLKFGLRAVKYGLNRNSNIACIIIFLVFGCGLELISPTTVINGMYIGIGSMMLVQLIQSVSLSVLVQTSPHKKKMQTIIPAVLGGIYLLLANTLSIGLKLVGMDLFGWNLAEISNAILLSSGMTLIIMIYMGGAMKMFWAATVTFFVLFTVYFSFSTEVMVALKLEEGEMILPLGVSILISYIAVIVATVLMYLIFLATYKLEFSKATWGAALNRAK